MFSNILALFLVFLTIADGEDAIHDMPHSGINVSVIDHDYVEFPTSLTPKSKVNRSGEDRAFLAPSYHIAFNPQLYGLFSDAIVRRFTQLHIHPLLIHWTKLVICKNAP